MPAIFQCVEIGHVQSAEEEVREYLRGRWRVVSRLATWNGGADRILTILQEAARKRHKEALRLGDPHVTADSALWTRIFERLVRWNAEFPYGEGSCSVKDAAQVLAMAEEFDVVERLQTALGVGGFSVTKSSGGFSLAITQDPSIEAADVYLELLTSPRRSSNHRVPEIDRWVMSLTPAKPVRGIPLLVRRAATRWARAEVEAYRKALPEGNLSSEFSLGGRLSLGVVVQHWASLVGMCHVLDTCAALTGHPGSTLAWLSREEMAARLVESVEDGGDLSVAQEMIDLLTFRPGVSPLAAPLIPCGDRLIVSPALINAIGIERLLLRTVAANPSRFGKVSNQLGKRASEWAALFREIPNVLVAEGVKVKRPDGSIAGDLDVVAIDPSAGIGLCVEVKWPIDAHTLKESIKTSELILSAARQLGGLRAVILTSNAAPVFPPKWPSFKEITWFWAVGTPQQLYAGKLPVLDLHMTSLRYLKQLPRADTLKQLIDAVARPCWPERNTHFKVGCLRTQIGRVRFEQEVIELGGPLRWRPQYPVDENGTEPH
ncbi:hypothetical protein ACFOY2_39625 [Nonomuraea purpurea]|uniref:Restriction endonuclease n=1 Tax=Nonomuraea purpurea TaxID=1849276 RepID=A0ABV8GM55_9ACTN